MNSCTMRIAEGPGIVRDHTVHLGSKFELSARRVISRGFGPTILLNGL